MALVWHGEKVNKAFQNRARQNVRKAAMLVEAIVKASMKKGGRVESGEAVIKAGTKTVKVDKVSEKKAGKIGSFRSKEGEVPRVQTGTLKRSITHETHPVLPIARVGTNTNYAPKLEFGTSRMAPRPFMLPALHSARAPIAAMWSKVIRGDGL